MSEFNDLPFPVSGCICNGVPRRTFLATGCATCAAGFLHTANIHAQDAVPAKKPNAMRIRVFFALHSPVQQTPDWPNIGFDFRPVMDHSIRSLNAAYDDILFLPSMVNGDEATKLMIDEDNELDGTSESVSGYVVMQLNCWNGCLSTALASGKPVLYVDFQFGGSGRFLCSTAGILRGGQYPNFGYVGSSDFDDILAAVQCFKTVEKSEDFGAAVTAVRIAKTPRPKVQVVAEPVPLETIPIPELVEKIKGIKLLAIGGMMGGQLVDSTKSELGIDVLAMDYTELNALWEKADVEKSAKLVAKWKETAQQIADDIPDETLMASAKMTLAMEQMLEKYDARGITINCLGGFYGGHIHAYPCLGFHELLNRGYVGACECDIRSSVTMLVMTTLTKGRPGYISDPVIDYGKGEIIYAHCVAANRQYGEDGPANPFVILTHSEDRAGASVRSIVPVGGITTTVEFSPDQKEILFHQAVVTANDPDDRACRTKICAVPLGAGGLERLHTQWDRYGWHRVTYFGDLKQEVFALAQALGWTVCEEA